MKDTDLVDSFYTKFVGMINQLKSHAETIADQRVIEKILRSLTPRFQSLVLTLEENEDMSVFTIDELQALLINHDDPGGYLWPPTYSSWTPTIVSFSFPVSLIIEQFTIFCSFRILNF